MAQMPDMGLWDRGCLAPINKLRVILAVLVALGTVLSFMPQLRKIARRQSSLGISHWSIMLSVLSAISNVFNLLVLQFPAIQQCTLSCPAKCMSNLSALLQVLVQTLMTLFVMAFFYAYFPEDQKHEGALESRSRIHRPSSGDLIARPSYWICGNQCALRGLNVFHTYMWGEALLAFDTCVRFFVCTLLMSVIVIALSHGGQPKLSVLIWTNSLSAISVITSVVQYIPQISYTLLHRSAGALSVSSMLIQVPGSFLVAYVVAASPGTRPSSWIPFIVGAGLQLILLCLCMTFDRDVRTFVRLRAMRYTQGDGSLY